MDAEVRSLMTAAQKPVPGERTSNRFLDLLEAGRIPREDLAGLAGALHRLVDSDRRSFALAASRFPAVPAGGFFLAMAEGESEALRLLLAFAAELEVDEHRLAAWEPQPLTQAYPAFLAQTALFGTRSDLALALLANVAESGGTYTRVADALVSKYGFSELATGHFRFFAATPQELLDQAEATLKTGLSAGDDPADAVRIARMVRFYEAVFWNTLAENAAA